MITGPKKFVVTTHSFTKNFGSLLTSLNSIMPIKSILPKDIWSLRSAELKMYDGSGGSWNDEFLPHLKSSLNKVTKLFSDYIISTFSLHYSFPEQLKSMPVLSRSWHGHENYGESSLINHGNTMPKKRKPTFSQKKNDILFPGAIASLAKPTY